MPKQRSLKQMMVHSLIVIPFIIAVSCALLFAAIQLLIREKQTAHDLLEDVKIGGATKRWQSAFELSKLLAHPESTPKEESFFRELISAFRASKEDDPRVRQYLALAMGRTGKGLFFEPLTEEIANEKEETLSAVIYAVGMLKDRRGVAVLAPFLTHRDPRIRSNAVAAIGTIGDPSSIDRLKKVLYDAEPNVQWGAALSLAKMGNRAGRPVILKLLNRKYLSTFPEVDPEEQNYLLLSAIEAAALWDEPEFRQALEELSQSDTNLKVRAFALERLK